jgi:hypothetical protein
VLERASQPIALVHFARAYIELLSGPTIYRYVPALMSDAAAHVHIIVALLLLIPLGTAAPVRSAWRPLRSDTGCA